MLSLKILCTNCILQFFIYKYALNSNISYKVIDKENVKAEWFKIEDLKNLNIKPAIIKNFNISEELQHLIIGD